jgi:hypothetical protein
LQAQLEERCRARVSESNALGSLGDLLHLSWERRGPFLWGFAFTREEATMRPSRTMVVLGGRLIVCLPDDARNYTAHIVGLTLAYHFK